MTLMPSNVHAFNTLTPAVTLTFHLQNLIRSSAVAAEYFLSVLSKLFKAFIRHRGNNIRPEKRTNERGGWTARKYNAFANTAGWRGMKESWGPIYKIS